MRAIAGLAVSVLVATTVAAQPRPDLSGSWVASAEAPPGGAAAPSPILGPRVWIRQEGERVTVIRPVRDSTFASTFMLDGAEVRTRVPGGPCQGDAELIETAAWEGAALALVQTGFVPSGAATAAKMKLKRVLRLQSPDLLVIEAPAQTSSPAAPQLMATVYKRSSDAIPDGAASPTARAAATVAQVAWIAGTWRGSSGGATVEEQWMAPAGGSMLATARTLRNTGMTSFEFLCIAERNGGLVYTAMPNGRAPATDFTLTTLTADSVTFENPTHDYPKAIRYSRRPDGSIETVVSGTARQPVETVILTRRQ